MSEIRTKIESAVEYLTEHPEEAGYTDSVARATLGDSLRVDVSGPDGESLSTDMPTSIGGRGEEPSPGWLYRAGLASCVAATVAMEAARQGVELDSLEVEVDSRSDDRGILGIDADIPAGPLSASVRIRASAAGPADGLGEILERGARRCPVFDATGRAVDVNLDVELG